MNEKRLKEIIETLLRRDKNELLSRINHYCSIYMPQGNGYVDLINKINATAHAHDAKTKEYHRRLYGIWFHEWRICFTVVMQEIIFTILEKAGPIAFKDYLKRQQYYYFRGQATIEEAYDFLTSLHSARVRLFLSLINNGSIAYVYIQKRDYEGFFNCLNRTDSGLDELLSFCKMLINNLDINRLTIRLNSGDYDNDNTDITRFLWYYLNIPNITSIQDSMLTSSRDIFSDEVDEQTKRKHVLLSYYRILKDFCRVNHEYYFKTTFDVTIDFICRRQWLATVAYIFFYQIERLGFSIEEEVLSRCDPDHLIVIRAKQYMKQRDDLWKSVGLKKPKGRKTSSWLNLDTIYSEAEIGQMFKDKIWRALNNRILRIRLIDPKTKKEIIGIRANKIRETLGCCFIFYSAHALGYAYSFEVSQSSFIRTAEILVGSNDSCVSRATIKKYMWVLNEAEGWDDKQPSYKTSCRKNNTVLTLILERNLSEIIKTIDFVKIELEKIFKNIAT